MNWEWYLAQLVNRSIDVLPWLFGGLSGVAIVSFSPLGRALVRYLRARQDESAITEQMLGELEEVRKVLGEVSERLDFTERRLAQEQLGLLQPRGAVERQPLGPPGAASTPH
jgi:hypothetical protein